MAVGAAGDRTGKLISDPDVWFAANAQIDGVAAHSTAPSDRLIYAVYQRRSLIEALKTKALLLAVLNPEQAIEAAQKYFAAVLPLGEAEKSIKLNIESAANWGAKGPLPGGIRAGAPVAKPGLVVGQKGPGT